MNTKMYVVKGSFCRPWSQYEKGSEWTEAVATSKDAAVEFIQDRIRGKAHEVMMRDFEDEIDDLIFKGNTLTVMRDCSPDEEWSYCYDPIDLESETIPKNVYMVSCYVHEEETIYQQHDSYWDEGLFSTREAAEQFCRKEAKRMVKKITDGNSFDDFWLEDDGFTIVSEEREFASARYEQWSYEITEWEVLS